MNKFKWSAPPQVGMEVIPHDCGQSMTKEMERMIGKPYKIIDEDDFNNYELNEGGWWHLNHLTPANWHFCNDGSARAMRCVKAMDTDHLGYLKYYGMSGTCNTTAHYDEPTKSYLCDLSQAEALLGLDEWEPEITRRFKVGDEVEWCIHGTWSKEFKIHTVESDHYIVSQKISNRASYWRADESDIRPAPKQPTMEEDITLLLKDKSFHVLETCKLIANDIMQIIKRHESK